MDGQEITSPGGMRGAALLALSVALCWTSAAVAAPILPVADLRFNQGTGAFPQTDFPDVPFSGFNSTIGEVVGQADQSSTVGDSSMSGSGSVIADGGGGAGGISHFEIVFQVSEAVSYSFTGSIFSSWLGFDEATQQNVIVDTPELREARLFQGTTTLQDVDGSFAVAGTLVPGLDYTLLLTAQNLERDFEDASWTFDFQVAPLPEPGSGLLVALGLLAAHLARWRRIAG